MTDHPSYKPTAPALVKLDPCERAAVRRGFARPEGRGRTWAFDLGAEIAREAPKEPLNAGLLARGYEPFD